MSFCKAVKALLKLMDLSATEEKKGGDKKAHINRSSVVVACPARVAFWSALLCFTQETSSQN